MFFLYFVIALTDSQQMHHDDTERAIYQRIEASKETISYIWRPNMKLLSDYEKARRCYIKFHLYKVINCDAELAQVDADLEHMEPARSDVYSSPKP